MILRHLFPNFILFLPQKKLYEQQKVKYNFHN